MPGKKECVNTAFYDMKHDNEELHTENHLLPIILQ